MESNAELEEYRRRQREKFLQQEQQQQPRQSLPQPARTAVRSQPAVASAPPAPTSTPTTSSRPHVLGGAATTNPYVQASREIDRERQLKEDEELARRLQEQEEQEEQGHEPHYEESAAPQQTRSQPPPSVASLIPMFNPFAGLFGRASELSSRPPVQVQVRTQYRDQSHHDPIVSQTTIGGMPSSNDEFVPMDPLSMFMHQLGYRRRYPGQPIDDEGGHGGVGEDDSYEALLRLQEMLGGNVSRGATEEQIEGRSLKFKVQDVGSLKEKTCAVCLDEYQKGDELRTLPCLHMFHQSCIDHWLVTNRSCPVCKLEITADFEEPQLGTAQRTTQPQSQPQQQQQRRTSSASSSSGRY